MEVSAWILVFSLIFGLLVYIGLKPLFSFRHEKKGFKDFEVYREWLKGEIRQVRQSVEIMSGELPAEIYDYVADAMQEKLRGDISVRFRVLTGAAVLCAPSGTAAMGRNKLVEMAFGGKIHNLELRIVNELPRNHIKIFDEIMAWVEDPHEPGAVLEKRTGKIVSGRSRVSLYLSDFEWYWKRAQSKQPICALLPRHRQ